MNWRAIFAIVRKDLKVISKSKGVLIPLIIVPVVMFVVLPLLTTLAPSLINMPGAQMNDMEQYLEMMPAGMLASMEGLNQEQQIVVLMLVYFLAPMYLIVPLMVASVIAADSFAGEKERKTMEALLYTPTSDRELFLAKLLSPWIPAVMVAWVGFILYSIVANLAGWPVMGEIFFPNWMWIVLVIWVAPAVAGLGLGTMVLVSSRVSGFQEAYQMGGAVVLPILLLVIGQATGVMYFNLGLVILLGAVLWLVDAVLIWFGVRTFQRSELIARI
jgi:ABC-2 type transport system permease protein